MRKVAYIFIACCLAAVGCTSGQVPKFGQPLSIEEYEEGFSRFGDHPLTGHQVEELIAERGPPDDVLEAKPRWTSFEHGVHVLSYIYYNKSAAGGSCIDTFVVVEDSGTIIKYYCR